MGGRLFPFALGCGLIVAACAFALEPAFASDDAVDAHPVYGYLPDFATPEEIFLRTQAVLQHFGVPAQADPQPALDALSGLQTASGVQALLKYFDPGSEYAKYTAATSDETEFFQDRQGFQVPDFSVSLRDPSTPAVAPAPASPVGHLIAARSNPSNQPLLGLRIALDPGHMGGAQWDEITGKWVRDAKTGRVLSEGVINLQTALLLESSLTQLGAQVMVTRHSLDAVTSADFNDFDMKASSLHTFQESSLLDWFQTLLNESPIGDLLYNAFSESSSFKDLFSPDRRWDNYNDLDLQARVDAIEAFHPDITLVIHFDTSCPAADPHGLNPGPAGSADSTKVYVPGAFDPTELASRDDRAQFAMHLLDQSAWDASVALAHSVANTLSADLHIPFDKSSPGLTRQVEPGVFSRNLYLLKKYQGSATAYAEGLFYNDPGEFNAFSNATHPMTIDGKNFPYSDRLAQVADAYKQAIVNFVESY